MILSGHLKYEEFIRCLFKRTLHTTQYIDTYYVDSEASSRRAVLAVRLPLAIMGAVGKGCASAPLISWFCPVDADTNDTYRKTRGAFSHPLSRYLFDIHKAMLFEKKRTIWAVPLRFQFSMFTPNKI